MWPQLYGTYTISNLINGRAFYKKDDGFYGIWWCTESNAWLIGPYSDKGQCIGTFFSREVDQYVQNVRYTWYYLDLSSTNDHNPWFKAGEGLLVSCLDSG